ncbi:MAG: DUF6152 family protein, partial [Arenicellales bacterium]|nr:DUF6152 family protein [Arenicellales bacterium]
HGPGPFDRALGIVLEGAIVRAWRYVHPHASVLVEVETEPGFMETWNIESESPNLLRRMGVLPDFLSEGDVITIHGYSHRTESQTIKLQSLVFDDGREVIVRRGIGDNSNTPQDLVVIGSSQPEGESRGTGGIAGIWAEGDGPEWENFDQATAAGVQWLQDFDVRDDPVRRCITPGFPRIVDQPLGLEIIEQKHQYVFLYETFHAVRRIYMDDREPTERTIPTRMGYSKGRWEDNTLIVETNRLDPLLLTWDGHPLAGGEKTHVTERYRRVGGQLQLELTVEDEMFWSEPLTRTVSYNLAPNLEILDYGCDPTVSTNWRAPE